MTEIDVLTSSPLDYAQAEHLPQLFGVTNPDIVVRLMQVPALRPDLSERVEEVLGEPEDIPISELAFMLRVVNADMDMMLRLSRIISVLVHAPSLSTTADGTVLRLAVAHAGTKAVTPHMRNPKSPTMDALPHTAALTQEILDLYTREALRFLVGLIPERLFQRVILRFPDGGLPTPSSLANKPASLAAFRHILDIAFSVAQEADLEKQTEMPEEVEHAAD